MFISKDFLLRFYAHIVLNLRRLDTEYMLLTEFSTPLILGVFGIPGEGKTLQTNLACKKLNIDITWLFSDSFESLNAGDPAGDIRTKYNNICELNSVPYETSKQLFTILGINDIDQKIGRKDNLIQQTINTQLINGLLMEMSDNSYDKYIMEKGWSRTPIVVTGNYLNELHGPLVRTARVDLINWELSETDVKESLEQMFPSAGSEAIRRIVRTYRVRSHVDSSQMKCDAFLSMSDFAAIKYSIIRNKAMSFLAKYDPNLDGTFIRRFMSIPIHELQGHSASEIETEITKLLRTRMALSTKR